MTKRKRRAQDSLYARVSENTAANTVAGAQSGAPEYAPSARAQSLGERLTEYEATPRAAYASDYAARIDRLLDAQLSRGDFEYDASADPLYAQYRDAYTLSGRRAMQDTAAHTAQLTGGRASSYAASAAAQAYGEHMTRLNDKLPEMYQQAYDRYARQGEDGARDIRLLQSLDEEAYGRYQDGEDRRSADRDYYAARYQQAREDDFEDYRARRDDWESDRRFDYDASRDAEDDRRWQSEFDYGASRDAEDDRRWQSEFDYGASRDAEDDRRWQSEFDYGASRDQTLDEQWRTEMERQTELDARDQRRWEAEHPQTESRGSSSGGGYNSYLSRATSLMSKQGNTAACEYLNYLHAQGMISQDTLNLLAVSVGADMGQYAQRKRTQKKGGTGAATTAARPSLSEAFAGSGA